MPWHAIPSGDGRSAARSFSPPSPLLWMLVGVLALNLLVALLAFTDLRSSHQAAYARTATSTRNLAQLLEREVSGVLDRASVALGSTVYQLEQQLAAGGIDRAKLWKLVDAEVALAPEVAYLGVFDAEGAQVCGIPASRCRFLNIADREHFLRQREQPTGLLLSGPEANRVDGEWSLILSRPLRRADGSFGGVAKAVLPLARIKQLFATLDLGAQGAVSLRDSDLTLLARHPGPLRMASEADNRKVSPELQAAIAAHPTGGAYVAATAMDGIERGNAYLRFTKYPLYVIVGLGTTDFLDQWRGELTRTIAICLLFLLATGGLTAVAWTHWHRRDVQEARLRSTLNGLAEGVVFQQQDGRIVDANPAAERILGLSRDQLLGLTSFDPRWQAVNAQGLPLAGEQHPAVVTLRTGVEQNQCVMGVREHDGDTRWLSVNTRAVGDGETVPAAVVASFTDITAARLAESQLRESEARLARVLEGTLQGFWDWNMDTGLIVVSPRFEAMLGYEPGTWVAAHQTWVDHVHPDDVAPTMARFEAHLAGQTPQHSAEFRMRDRAGNWHWILSLGRVTSRDDSGRPVLVSGTHTDITERKQLEERLRVMNKDFTTVLESTSDFIFFKDRHSRFRFCSQTLARITGHASWRDMQGKHDREVFPPELAAVYQAEEAPVFEQGVALLNRVDPYLDEDGQPGWVSTNKWPVFDDDGRSVIGIFGISRVVTEQKQLEDELRRLAATDGLTGVASRRSFMEAVRLELARLARHAAHPSSVLMFDLDHFKLINDRHGHAAGDSVLRHVAELAGQAARRMDSVGRLGGEEFAVLLVGSGLAEAMVFAERLRARIANTPLSLDCGVVEVTVSIGVTVLSAADGSPEQVLARADQAMYRAKHQGRNRVDAEPVAAGVTGAG